MQFYLNGYRPGDPLIEDPHPSVAERPVGLPEEVDVLIVGCGPAGLVLAAQMANPEARSPASQRSSVPRQTSDAGPHPLPVAVTSTTEGREPNA